MKPARSPTVTSDEAAALGVSIRRARAHDAGRMHQLQQRAFAEEGRRCGTTDIPPLTEPAAAIAEHVAHQRALVAVIDDAVVGCVRGLVEGGVCTVRGLVVDPDHQGRGLGSRLLRALEASLEGVTRIDLTTNTIMEGNEPFYRRHGYQATGTTCPVPGIRLVHMSKAVAPAPKLLAGGNPQVAKADGDAPVQAYLAAIPGWKRDVAQRLDQLITRTVPGVHKAVRWNSAMYGLRGNGWFASTHVFTHYVKLTFFKGALLDPAPDGGTAKEARWINIPQGEFDEARLVRWVEQAAALPGWGGS